MGNITSQTRVLQVIAACFWSTHPVLPQAPRRQLRQVLAIFHRSQPSGSPPGARCHHRSWVTTVATGIVGKAGWHAINGNNIPLLTYIDIYWSDWLGGINPSIFQPASGTKGPLGIDAPPRGSSSGASFDFGRTTFYALPIPTSLWKPSTYHIQKSRGVNIGHALYTLGLFTFNSFYQSQL